MPAEVTTHRKHGGGVENMGVDMAGGVLYGTKRKNRVTCQDTNDFFHIKTIALTTV
jgi:hypothetical protein